jgi:WD40 repeat protein
VYHIAFSPNGELLAVAGEKARADKKQPLGTSLGALTLWDVKTRKLVHTLVGHKQFVSALAFSPDGKALASGSWDKTVRLWDIKSGKELAVLKGATDWVMGLAFSPDGSALAGIVAADNDGGNDFSTPGIVLLWDIKTHKVRAELKGASGPVRAIAFSPDGKTLAAASGKWDPTDGGEFTHGEVVLWDAITGKLKKTLKVSGEELAGLAFSPDGKTLVTARGVVKREAEVDANNRFHFHGEVQFWDTSSGRIRKTVESEGWPEKVVFSADGQLLAVQTTGGKGINLLDPATMKVLGPLPDFDSDDVEDIAFSSKGKVLAVTVGDRKIGFWQFSER